MIKATRCGWSRSCDPRCATVAARPGQSLVEYAVTVPVFLLILLGMLEFGFAFSHHLTMEYASREGARTGAALDNGTTIPVRLRRSRPPGHRGGPARPTGVGRGRARPQPDRPRSASTRPNAKAGADTGQHLGAGTPAPGPTIGGVAPPLPDTSGNWNACGERSGTPGRTPTPSASSITYTYHFVTPLGVLDADAPGRPIAMSDRTVMALNPALTVSS